MGIISFFKSKKKPDLSKRQPGYGVAAISPYLFDQDGKEDFFTEVKRLLLPYLTDEEEEAIVEFFKNDRRSFRAFIPEEEFDSLSDINDEAKTFDVRLTQPWYHVKNPCCPRWVSSDCCGGMKMTEHLQRLLSSGGGGLSKCEDELKDYFIIDHIDFLEERDGRDPARKELRSHYMALETGED